MKKEKEKFEVALLLPFFSSHIVHIEQPNTQLFQIPKITNIIQKHENKKRPRIEHVCKWQYLVKADRPRKVELDGNQS